MEGGVAPGTGASFEFAEYTLPETLPLIIGMDTHAHDFSPHGRGATKSSHGNETTFDLAKQKFTIGVEIVLFNGIDIVVPGTAPKIGSSGSNGKHMQELDGGLVRRGITPDGKHVTLILLHSSEHSPSERNTSQEARAAS